MLHHNSTVHSPAFGRNDAKPVAGVFTSFQPLAPAAQSSSVPGGNAMEGVFHQIEQWLAAFNDEAGTMLESSVAEPTAQARWSWLQPNTRQAEAAMHRLRDLRLAQTPAGTELSQSLTVLVLAADMLVQGQLCGGDEQESYALLRRNADRAQKSLSELRTQFSPDAQPSENGD